MDLLTTVFSLYTHHLVLLHQYCDALLPVLIFMRSIAMVSLGDRNGTSMAAPLVTDLVVMAYFTATDISSSSISTVILCYP